MTQKIDRRGFVKSGCALGAGFSLVGWFGRTSVAAAPPATTTPNAQKLGWLLCAELYTFRRFSFYEAQEMIAKLGFRYVEPCFFLRLDKNRPELKVNESLSADQRKQLRTRLADRGMQMLNFYSNLGNAKVDSKKVFDFAKEMGVQAIVAEPPEGAFDGIEKLCNEYQINLAVHNHPKKPNYKNWKPENVLALCRGRGPRIGACCDTGHWVRSGLDPVECLKKMEGRIHDIHLKDVIESGNPAARDVPLGQGKANYAAVLREIHRQGYRGAMTVEYEHDSPKLMDDVAQCVAFVEQTAKQLAG